MSRARLVITVAIAALVGAGLMPMSAPADTLSSATAVPRTCFDGPAGEGTAQRSYVPAADGLLTLKLNGPQRSDWDLAAFRARDGRLMGASSAFGSTEQTLARVNAGEEVLIQACRRLGPEASVALWLDLHTTPPAPPGEPVRLVEVPFGGQTGLRSLEATGLDVTHDMSERNGIGFAKVVIYSEAELRRLAAAGFPPRVVIGNMAAFDRSQRRAESTVRARSAAQRALPSDRTSYRQMADYQADLKRLVEQNPGLVRKVTLPLKSLEGRPIEGVEIADEVERTDDGRPVNVQLGIHHAREWPSGEFPMEFAIDLVNRFNSGNTRVRALLSNVRVVVLPMMNPDGFAVSRGAGEPTPADDDDDLTLSLALSDAQGYKRKNCRANTPPEQATPCASRTTQGVDLNRNYGAFYGGAGTSTNPAVQNYRGPGPYSEPESEAFHRFSAARQITEVISNHTFTDQGVFFRQPGFRASFFPKNAAGEDISPDEAGMKELGDAMGAATGWESLLGWKLSDITGATEDWNYFAQGAFGYTPEGRGPNFHANFATMVAREYEGTGAQAGRGVREAFLLAAEQAGNRRDHSVIRGRAGVGQVLRLRKSFDTRTSLEGVVVKDRLDTTMTVPSSGRYEWEINPSTRPLFSEPGESWTLTCETAGGRVLATERVDVARGQAVTRDVACAPAAQTGARALVDGCNVPTAARTSRSLDRVRLGMPRAAVRRRFARREKGRRFVDRFCLSGPGSLRVGYPSLRLQRKLASRERLRTRRRAVLVLSSSPSFTLRGVRPGTTVSTLRERIGRSVRPISLGRNRWYL